MSLDKERIINSLKCCQSPTPIDCRNCNYKDQTTPMYIGCVNLLVSDALSLIQEQEKQIIRLKGTLKFPEISIGDFCIYGFWENNKSLAIVNVVRFLSSDVADVKIIKVIIDDTGNKFLDYLFRNDKSMFVSVSHLKKICY